MTTIAPGVGCNSPALLYQNVDYGSLLTDPFADNQLFLDFTNSMNTLFDGVIHYASDELYYMRDDEADPLFIAYNTRMLGYSVPLNSFSSEQYQNLLQSLGTFFQTKGASLQFLNFLSYIENAQFNFIPLWANSTSNTIQELVDVPGTPVWESGGTYFPTPFYDLEYNDLQFPNLNVQAFLQLLYKISPIYLVPRSLLFITNTTEQLYITPTLYEMEIVRSVAKQ